MVQAAVGVRAVFLPPCHYSEEQQGFGKDVAALTQQLRGNFFGERLTVF